jgi:cytochrome P450
MGAHASDLVLAGSDTTATALACMLYYLLRDQNAMTRLITEVRGAFCSYGEINNVSTSSLKYLRGVILEGLRMYPPVPLGLPRTVPKGGDTVDGHFLPEGVSRSPTTTAKHTT